MTTRTITECDVCGREDVVGRAPDGRDYCSRHRPEPAPHRDTHVHFQVEHSPRGKRFSDQEYHLPPDHPVAVIFNSSRSPVGATVVTTHADQEPPYVRTWTLIALPDVIPEYVA